ncbi:MAG TPA: VCBS repeat-containing protein, partial [Candidatus Sulfotelmatobacter sp.]
YGDFNGDGNLDVAFAQGSGKNASTVVTLMLGDGKGHFNVGSHTNDSLGLGIMAAADFNGDGKLDLVIGGGQGIGCYSAMVMALSSDMQTTCTCQME